MPSAASPDAAPDGADRSLVHRVLDLLPKGSQLSARVWERRHRAILSVAYVQSAVVFGFGVWRGFPPVHVAGEAGAVAAVAVLAHLSRAPHAWRAAYATLSLVMASAMLVHQADGITEWHFHFFVMVGLITLYQEWMPFLVAIAFVVLHHGLFGAIDPEGVYGTAAAVRAPWRWALIHAGFVLAAAAVHVAAWRLSEEQGATDPLTGLPNRLGFTDLVDHQISHDQRVAVLFVDLDGFKLINDGLGHDAGDEVLRHIGARLREVLRAGDHAARLGGDEFAVMIQGPDVAEAERIAARLLLAISDSIYLKDRHREVHLRASIGIALSEPGLDGVELVRRADIAMYSAKRQGGGRSAVFESGLEEIQLERAEFADDLRVALQHDQLRLVYQPVVDIATGEIEGVEALLRWRHPVRGEVSPARFIAIAEESGLIAEIGEWVLDQAIAQLARWSADGLQMSLAINVSTRQLDDLAFGTRLMDRLSHHGIAPRQVVLELTESVLVLDLDAMATTLHALRARGVRVAIDDFGTGYSSMSYLSRLPVDVVKIDQSFVQRLATGATESALVRSIIELASSLDLGIIAEGVEDHDQAAVLRAMNCSTGQGYLWSRPVEAVDIPELVASARPAATAA